jgi:Protein of unknown function (DUF4238)
MASVLVMSRAKRHHYVPASYLTRFGVGGKVLVRPRGRRMYVTSVINVAVEAGLYEVRDAEGEPTDAVERALAGLEGTASTALTTIEQTQQLPPNGSAERETLATFLAVQFTRTPDHRELILFPERVAKYAADRAIDADLMTEYLQKVHLGFKPEDGEVRGALDFTHFALQDRASLTKDNAIRITFGTLRKLQPALLGMHWSLEVARRPRLITSDAPLVIWRKPSDRDPYWGVGVGNADEIRFPISPAMQLVMTPESREPVTRIEPDRVRACNADVAHACYRVVVGHPRREQQLERLDLPARPAVFRFHSGPGYRAMPDGTDEYLGEVIHVRRPRR